MESEVYYKRVGVFISISTIVIIAIVFWLFGLNLFKPGDNYIVYFENQSLDGLQKDSLVTMKGVRVGLVDDYNISPTNIQRVKVLLSLDKGVPVKEDTRAVIRRNLLTGIAKIDLIGGTQSSPPLKYVKNEIDEYPVIKEEVAQLDKIADSLPDLVVKFDNIASRLVMVLSEDNIKALDITVSSLSKFSLTLSNLSPAISRSIENTEKISQNINEILQAMTGSGEKDGIMTNLNEASEEVKSLLEEFKLVVNELTPFIVNISRSSEKITRDISKISNSISNLSETYEDPQAIIKGKHE